MSAYLPPNEAAMSLYVPLKGEAEEELEHGELSRINCSEGVNNILEMLRSALKTRVIYQKRKYLFDFEHVARYNAESIRSFCDRYHRIERSLIACKVDIGAMYDSEARGARLLDRLRLSAEQQRLVLVGTGQSLHFDAVKEAVQLQFPDHRPVPPVTYTREFDKDNARGQEQRQPNGRDGKPEYNKGKGKGKPRHDSSSSSRPNKAFVTERVDDRQDTPDDDHLPDIREEDDEPQDEGNDLDDDDPELVPDGADDLAEDDDIASAVMEAANVLTVTARRLQGVRLGRKFSGPKQSIEDRKKQSHCAACGEKGHWRGDPSCSMSGKPSGGGNDKTGSKSFPKAQAKKPAGSKVMIVHRPEGDQVVPIDDPAEENYFTAFVCKALATHVPDVFIAKPGDFAGYAVLDTACQKTVCSRQWLNGHLRRLKQHKLTAKVTEEKEGFQFGVGEVQFSAEHAYLPVCWGSTSQTCCLLGTSVMHNNSDIPLLLSLPLIERKLRAVLDFPKGCARLGAFQTEVPIVKINGHICISISEFPPDKEPWSLLSSILDQGRSDSELVRLPPPLVETTPDGDKPTSSCVASRMAVPGSPDLRGRDDFRQVHGSDRALGTSQSKLAGPPGSDAPGDGRVRDPGGKQTMQPPSGTDGAPRQPIRKVLPMRPMRNKVETQRQGGLGRAAIVAAAAAAAAIRNFFGAAGLGETSSTRTSSTHDVIGDLELPECLWRPSQDESQVQAKGQEGEQQASGDSGGGRGQRLRLVPGPRRLKPGAQTWLTSHLRNTRQLYDQELESYEGMPVHRALHLHHRIDLLEIFAGAARVTANAHLYGLAALQPVDKAFDFDLSELEGVRALKHAIKKFEPLCVLVSWPCTLWSLFNENLNYSKQPDALGELRHKELPVVEAGAWACEEQLRQGRIFLGENPVRSRLWRLQCVKDLIGHPDVKSVDGHAGAYGAENTEGMPIIKPLRWISNSETLLENLGNKLSEEQQAYCAPVQGKDTKSSGYYCDGLVHAILDGIAKEARRRNPARFAHKAKEVYFARPVPDAQAWKHIMDELEARFANTHKKPFVLSKEDPLHKAIEQLIPWKITRLQATWTPQARRFPSDIPFTHRGAVLRRADDEFVLEAEDLSSVQYPKQRYTTHTSWFVLLRVPEPATSGRTRP